MLVNTEVLCLKSEQSDSSLQGLIPSDIPAKKLRLSEKTKSDVASLKEKNTRMFD